jgi:hypothetical protein
LELADKPGSVKFVRKQTATIIHLGQQSLTGSSNTPDLNYAIATVSIVKFVANIVAKFMIMLNLQYEKLTHIKAEK